MAEELTEDERMQIFVKAHYLANAFPEKEELELIYRALTHTGVMTGIKAHCVSIVARALQLYDTRNKYKRKS